MPSIVRLVPVLALLVITGRVPAAVAADAPRLSLTIAHPLVRPGEKQTVTVSTAPHRALTLSVIMPNGATIGQHGSSSATGRLRFTFVQPANALSRYSRVAIVHVSLDDNPARSVEGAYRVAFAAIDLVVPSQPIPENSNATVWVHTRPRTLVEVWDDLWDWPQEVKGTTGSHGWFAAMFHFPNESGSPTTVTIDAHALIAGRSVDTTATVTVQGFAFMSWVVLTQILHLQNGAWVATTQVRVGEEFRVTASGFLNEPAGTSAAFVPGTVTIRKVETVLASGALQSELGNFDEYAEFRLTDPADVGPLEAVVDDHPTTGGLPFTLVAAQQ
jgi:hypothetical protein